MRGSLKELSIFLMKYSDLPLWRSMPAGIGLVEARVSITVLYRHSHW